MTSPRDRKETMLAAGQRSFLERGYTATTVDAICDAAGVTKGSFFHHFTSKDDFAAGVLRYTWQPVVDAHEPEGPDTTIAISLDDHIRFMARWMGEAGRLLPMVARELGSTQPAIGAQVRGYFSQWMSYLESLLQTAVSTSASSTDLDGLKEFIIATIEGLPVASAQFGPQALTNVSERLVRAVMSELGLSAG